MEYHNQLRCRSGLPGRSGSNIVWCLLAVLSLLASACGPGETRAGQDKFSGDEPAASLEDAAAELTAETRIVSLNGTISEILSALGLEENIVGTDVTSTYPSSLAEKPKVGHNRNISAEGVLSLQPDLVLARAEELDPVLKSQFEAAGVQVLAFDHEYSVEGSKKLIRDVAASFNLDQKAKVVIAGLDRDLDSARQYIDTVSRPKVLFIYARGTGTLMVAGENTQVEQMIELAGGQNAIEGFEDFKPLTSESLVAANPDVILLFDSGLASLGGMEGLLKVQGIAQTNAGKNRKVIEMDGQLLTGFSPRLGKALAALAQGIR